MVMEIEKNRERYHQNIRTLKSKLIEEHGCRCGYCNTPIFGIMSAQVDNYYPVRYFKDRAWTYENLVLTCKACNIIKSATVPVTEDGKILILHPYKQKYSDYMAQKEDGELIGLTEEGISTIRILNLNRPELIEYRRENSEEFATILIDSSSKPISNYEESIQNIKKLLNLELPDAGIKDYYYRVLYGNVISAMEAYLSRTVLTLVTYNEDLKWQCVERFDWGKEKVEINKIRDAYLGIDLKLLLALQEVLYHNMEKVQAIFKKCFDISILSEHDEMEYMCKAAKIRHNIVHRNGRETIDEKTKGIATKYIIISQDNILELINHTDKMIDEIERQIKDKDYYRTVMFTE